MINPSKCFSFSDISSKENNWSTSLYISQKLPYFDGHFPSQAILPAVAIVDANLEFIKAIGGSSQLKEIHRAKFLKIVSPQDHIDIVATKISENRWSIAWTSQGSLAVHMQLTMS